MEPNDGHCIVLMEAKAEERTFSDYPNTESCLDNLLNIYEENPDHVLDYKLDDIWKWLDSFHKITLFVYDKELGRYKKHKHSELKELFISEINRVAPAWESDLFYY